MQEKYIYFYCVSDFLFYFEMIIMVYQKVVVVVGDLLGGIDGFRGDGAYGD